MDIRSVRIPGSLEFLLKRVIRLGAFAALIGATGLVHAGTYLSFGPYTSSPDSFGSVSSLEFQDGIYVCGEYGCAISEFPTIIYNVNEVGEIDWGDGYTDLFSFTSLGTHTLNHTYAAAGSYSYVFNVNNVEWNEYKIVDGNEVTEFFDGNQWTNSGTFVIQSPVPEPETYAMLLAGLGFLGFAARRRKLKEAATV